MRAFSKISKENIKTLSYSHIYYGFEWLLNSVILYKSKIICSFSVTYSLKNILSTSCPWFKVWGSESFAKICKRLLWNFKILVGNYY